MRDNIYWPAFQSLPLLFYKLDATTLNHSVRVALICDEIRKVLPLSEDIVTAALLHDIGKVYVSRKILDKPEPISKIEREIIDLHPYIGFKILSEYGIKKDIRYMILYHHSYDPPCLVKIPEDMNDHVTDYTNILHTVDIYEAINSDRPYHRGHTLTETLTEMEGMNNIDKRVTDYLRSMERKTSVAHREYGDYRDKGSEIIARVFNGL